MDSLDPFDRIERQLDRIARDTDIAVDQALDMQRKIDGLASQVKAARLEAENTRIAAGAVAAAVIIPIIWDWIASFF
jgi:hypothetical protein